MTSGIKLTADEMRYIALFESITGATAKDCLIEHNRHKIVFVTKENEAGLAVGKNGAKVKVLRRAMGRNIEIIEYAPNAQDFIRNAFIPARMRELRVSEKPDGRKFAVIKVDQRDKGIAIGKGGERAERIRQLAKKYFDIENIIIM